MCTAHKHKISAKDCRFADLGRPERIWAISAIHGETERLMGLHDRLLPRIRPGDRVVYLGNYTGHSQQAVSCVDEILTFRRLVLSQPGMICADLVYLRGAQEEMMQKLLQLQFAPNPADVLLWMLGNGVSDTLYSYGLSPHDGIEACGAGVTALGKWTAKIRAAIRARPGHEIFGTHLIRAAHTATDLPGPLLFVHSGIDTAKPLEEQGDQFWWAGRKFSEITLPYAPFGKIIRGYDPGHAGIAINCVTASIDGGCGFGGTLVCAGISPEGEILETLET